MDKTQRIALVGAAAFVLAAVGMGIGRFALGLYFPPWWLLALAIGGAAIVVGAGTVRIYRNNLAGVLVSLSFAAFVGGVVWLSTPTP